MAGMGLSVRGRWGNGTGHPSTIAMWHGITFAEFGSIFPWQPVCATVGRATIEELTAPCDSRSPGAAARPTLGGLPAGQQERDVARRLRLGWYSRPCYDLVQAAYD